LTYFGFDSIGSEEKTDMRDLILSGDPWSASEKMNILVYCQSDVDALGKLLPALVRKLSDRPYWLEHAINRGSYSMASGFMEYNGIPMDVDMLNKLQAHWPEVTESLIAEVAKEYPVFEGKTFKQALFADYLIEQGIAWPRTEKGSLALDRETFRQQVRQHPQLAPIREVRDSLSQLRLSKIQVGEDGRNRTLLSQFRAKTGRNLPSNAKFIFGPSAWLRSLIKPREGFSVAYVDFSSQEIAIAAALSGDPGMQEGYINGDPYLDFAVRAGLAPKTATKTSHKAIRQMSKQIVLGTQYGMQAETLSQPRAGILLCRGQQLLRAHKEAYPVYWHWVESLINHSRAVGYVETVFGWRKLVSEDDTNNALQNFPCQANGAEMLRLACVMAMKSGLKIIAPVHDAILLEAPFDTFHQDVKKLQDIMTEAGAIILDGFEVRTDADLISYPDRYQDERGIEMWDKVTQLVEGFN
jgi:DNA polymerase I-like protein with 3'-5' exonuclease and polymerase domains